MDGRPTTAASTQHPLCPGTKAKGVSTGEHSKERPRCWACIALVLKLHVPMLLIKFRRTHSVIFKKMHIFSCLFAPCDFGQFYLIVTCLISDFVWKLLICAPLTNLCGTSALKVSTPLVSTGHIYLSFFDRYHAPGLDRLPHYEWRPTPSTPPALPPHAPNVTKGRKYVMPSFIHDSWYDPCLSVSLNSSLTEELSSVGLVYLSSTFLIMEQICYITPYDIKRNTLTRYTN